MRKKRKKKVKKKREREKVTTYRAHLAQVHRIQARLGHCAHNQEQAVRIVDPPSTLGRRAEPEDNRRQQARHDKVQVVQRDVVDGRQLALEAVEPRGAARRAHIGGGGGEEGHFFVLYRLCFSLGGSSRSRAWTVVWTLLTVQGTRDILSSLLSLLLSRFNI